MYVCMCMYVCVCMYVRCLIHAYSINPVCPYAHTYTPTHTHTDVHPYIHYIQYNSIIHINIHRSTHTHTYIHRYILTCVHTIHRYRYIHSEGLALFSVSYAQFRTHSSTPTRTPREHTTPPQLIGRSFQHFVCIVLLMYCVFSCYYYLLFWRPESVCVGMITSIYVRCVCTVCVCV